MTALQALRICLAGGAFVGFGLGGALLSWLVLPLASLDFDRTRRQRRCQRLVQATFVFFHDYMRWCGLVHYDPRKVAKDLPEGAFMFVTNHPTLIDISALIAAYGELCVVAKSSLFKNPLIGPLLRLCGHIESKKNAFGEPSEVVAQAVERLRRGQRVLIFPEGSRSPEHGMRRFHQGAFSAAVEAGVPVMLAAIRAEPPGLKKGQAWYAIPKRAIVWTLKPLPPIEPNAERNAKDLLVLARQRIEEELRVA